MTIQRGTHMYILFPYRQHEWKYRGDGGVPNEGISVQI